MYGHVILDLHCRIFSLIPPDLVNKLFRMPMTLDHDITLRRSKWLVISLRYFEMTVAGSCICPANHIVAHIVSHYKFSLKFLQLLFFVELRLNCWNLCLWLSFTWKWLLTYQLLQSFILWVQLTDISLFRWLLKLFLIWR